MSGLPRSGWDDAHHDCRDESRPRRTDQTMLDGCEALSPPGRERRLATVAPRRGRSPGPRRSLVIPTLLAVLLALLGSVWPGPGATGLAAQPATPAVPAAPGPDPALAAAVAYLLGQQLEGGAFAGLSGEPDRGATADAVAALAAARQRGVDATSAIGRAVADLETNGAGYAATGAGPAAKLTLAAIAGGSDPRRFGDRDLIAGMLNPAPATAAPAAAVGFMGDDLFDHALVLLALAAAHEPIPPAAIDVVRQSQLADGSWDQTGAADAATGDSNTTSLVMQALVATGNGADPMVESALAYLQSVRTELGQFLYQAGEPEMADANSTALAVQALIAAGQDPSSPEWGNAARGLTAFQNVSGAFRYIDAEPADNLFATIQAVPALAGYALPVAAACAEPAPAAEISATPEVVALPAPGRGRAPCVAPAA